MTRVHSHTHTRQNKSWRRRPLPRGQRAESFPCSACSNLKASHLDRITERCHVVEAGCTCSGECASLWFRCCMPALLLHRVRLVPNTRPADVGGRGAAVYIGFLSMALRIVSHARHTHLSQVTHHTSHHTSQMGIYKEARIIIVV